MAEQHSPGRQKMFYSSRNSESGLDVTVKICCSDSEDCVEEKELEESTFPGVYFFYHFFRVGVYLAAFSENGIRTVSQVYTINGSPKIGAYRGPQVVNQ